MKASTFALQLVAGIFFACASDAIAKHPAAAFIDVTVVPMDHEHTLAHQTVVVRSGRIVTVGDMRKVVVPEDAVRIDGKGLHLMPGLADMHVHLHSPEDARLFLAYGVTTVRNMRGLPQHLAWKQQIESGEMLAPRLYSCGPTLDGAPPSGEAMTVVETPDEGARRVREQQAAGYDCIKVYTRLSRDVYDAIVREANRLGMPVSGHVPSTVGVGHVLDMRQNSIEHLTGYMAALKSGDNVDPEEIPTLARATQATGVWNCATLVVQQKLAASPEAAAMLDAHEMQYVAPLRRAMWDPSRQGRMASLPEEEFHAARRGIEVLKKLTLALQRSGAGILLGTDAPSRFVIPGFSIHEELRNLTDAGLTPYEAILAGTRAASDFLRADFGVVAPGKRADLLLVRGNPLKDITAAGRIAGVMSAGRWLPESELQDMLREISESYRASQKRFTHTSLLPEDLEQYRYEILQAGVFSGEERVSIRVRPEGGRELLGQASLDSPFHSEYAIQVEEDAEGAIRFVRIETHRAEGSGWIEAVREPQRAVARIHLPFVSTASNLVEDLADNTALGTTMLAARIPLFQAALKLDVGGSMTVSTRDLDLFTIFNTGQLWMDSTWTFRRLSDAKGSRVFTVERVAGYSTVSGRLILDEQGIPLYLTAGNRTYRRSAVLRAAQ